MPADEDDEDGLNGLPSDVDPGAQSDAVSPPPRRSG